MRAELAEIIEFAMEQGLKRLEVFSNGTRISDRLMDLFSRYGVCLAVSFYSCNERTHDAITGVEGSCRATLETLERARHRGINVRVGLPVMRRNEGDIQKTRAFLRDNDLCKEIRVDAIRPVGRGLDPALNPAEYDPVRSRPNFRASWETYVKSLAGNSCWFGKLAVTSTGDVLPCVFARNDAVGNITRQSLRDVVHSARTQSRWRLTADQIETCGACEFRHVCRDCRVLAAGEEGDLYRRRGRCGYDPHRGTWS